MKRIILLLFGILVFVTGCGIEYKIHGHYVTLDESVDFRHIHYKTSTSFDVGSDKSFKSYSLYDKRPKVLYSVTVNRVKGKIKDGISALEKKEKADKKDKKIGSEKWTIISYKEEDIDYTSYFSGYDENEYYRIDFYNSKLGKEFENNFIKKVKIK